MNWFEEELWRQYGIKNRYVPPWTFSLAGDVWLRDHPKEHLKDMERYNKAVSESITHYPDGSVSITIPELPISRQMNLVDMQRRLDQQRK